MEKRGIEYIPNWILLLRMAVFQKKWNDSKEWNAFPTLLIRNVPEWLS